MPPTEVRAPGSTSRRRCVITGVGVLSAIGCGFEEYARALREGVCGLTAMAPSEPGSVALEVAGQIKDLPTADEDDLGRYTRLTLAAARQALELGGVSFNELAPGSGLLLLATAMGPCDVIERLSSDQAAPPALARQQLFQFTLATVADALGFSGEATQLTHGCSAGNYALTYARDAIGEGRHDIALVGAGDILAQVCVLGYDRFGILATRSRPFDLHCEGMAVGEGVGFLLLESEERARQRGAKVYAEIAGGATTIDAYQTLSPNPDGVALQRSMEAALENAGVTPPDVDYVSASAPGTPLGDRAEARAIRQLFEPTGRVPPVSATKSQTGNCHGASAMLEAIACVAAIEHGFLPPTIALEQPNEDCTFDVVAGQSRPQQVSVALNNATGLGGADSSVVIRRYSG